MFNVQHLKVRMSVTSLHLKRFILRKIKSNGL